MRKNIFCISFIWSSLMFLTWATTVSAVIRTTITVAPNPAEINEEVTITFVVNDNSSNPNKFNFIDLYVDNTQAERKYCPGATEQQGVNPCTVEFKENFGAAKQYEISGRANNITLNEPQILNKATLIVLGSGGPPPPPPPSNKTPVITNISPDTAAINSIVDISGTDRGNTGLDFCSNNSDFNLSSIQTLFKQGSQQISASPLPQGGQQGSSCGKLRVAVPMGLTPNQSAEVRVQNTGGVSEPKPLNILPPVAPTPPGGSAPGAESKLNIKWPKSPLGTPLNESSDITQLIKYLYEWLVSLGGLAAFVVLLLAGFQYLTSAGDAGKMKEAKDRIKSAVLGLALLLGSVLILNTINPQLTTLKMPTVKSIGEQCNECKNQWPNEWQTKCKQECGIMDTKKPSLIQQCNQSVQLYKTNNSCSGNVSNITVDGPGVGSLTCGAGAGACSIRAAKDNLCLVEFYDTPGCGGKPIAPGSLIGDQCMDFDKLYFAKSVQCIKVKKP